ncbi:chorismate mutase [Tumebacillus flagellatus]|uniref:chorismate mutase n=1 Tax=Tumebacillus flagellatus TaxID=1157490 RepID=A0A074LTA3_9BACL|nr:chorismate mutase [Tumebacillus flagellatus]
MRTRGVRGATTVTGNDAEEIRNATRELLLEMVRQNDVEPEEIASCLFTSTPDLNAAFPASAVRTLDGWQHVPLVGAQEVEVINALPRCVRVLMHINTTKRQAEIQHVYLREAAALRPDLAKK